MKLPTRILKLLLEQERPLTIAALSAAVGHDEKIRELVTHLAGAGLVRQLDGKGPAQFVVTKDGIDAYYERADRTHELKSTFTEKDLYPPFAAALQQEHPGDLILNVSALRRPGQWSNPDIVRVHVQRFPRLRSSRVEVTTYEVKAWNVAAWTTAHAFEAAAHRAFAHRAFLVLEWHAGLLFDAKIFEEWTERVRTEGPRLGIGVATFQPGNPVRPFRAHAEAPAVSPDDGDVEKALEYWLVHMKAEAAYDALWKGAPDASA